MLCRVLFALEEQMKNKAFIYTLFAGIIISVLSFIFLWRDFDFLNEFEWYTTLHFERDNWLAIFLSVAAILASLYTALVANNLSDISFKSFLLATVKDDHFEVVQLFDYGLIRDVLSEKKQFQRFEKFYKLEFNVENCFVPILKYELEYIAATIGPKTETLNGFICPEVGNHTNKSMSLFICSDTKDEQVQLLPLLANPKMFPQARFGNAKIEMVFKINMRKPSNTQYMQFVLYLQKTEDLYRIKNSSVQLLTKREAKRIIDAEKKNNEIKVIK